MAFRTAYEMQKWQTIQEAAAEPLAKILNGNFSNKDVNKLGLVLRDYDTLAHSILSEGVKAVESSAKARVEKVSTYRERKGKKSLTARQLAIIYSQALDKAQKETMPQLLASIKEIIELQSQPAAETVPELPRFGLDRVAFDHQAANERIQDKLSELDASINKKEIKKPQSVVERIDELKKNLASGLAKIYRLISRSSTDEEDSLKELIENLEEKTETGVVNPGLPSGVKVEPKPEPKPVKEQPKVPPLNEEKRKKPENTRSAEAKARKQRELLAKELLSRGLLHKLTRRIDRGERLKELRAERKKQNLLRNPGQERGLRRAVRVARNTKDESAKVLRFLKDKYQLARFKRLAPPDMSGALRTAALVGLLGTAVAGLFKGFTEKFDVDRFLDETLGKSISQVWEKVKSFIGIDSEPSEMQKATAEREQQQSKPYFAEFDAGKQHKEEWEAKARGKVKVMKDIRNGQTYSPQEAEAIKANYDITVPSNLIDANKTTPVTPPTEGPQFAASPSKQAVDEQKPGTSSGSGSATGSGAASPSGAGATAPVGGAPTSSTTAQSPAPGGGGGLSASTPIALSTAPVTAQGSAGQEQPPVTAVPKAPEAPKGNQTQGSGTQVKSSPQAINLSSVPSSSLNSEAGFVQNAKQVY